MTERIAAPQIALRLLEQQDLDELPSWERFEVHDERSFVAMRFGSLASLTAWARALGHLAEPDRYPYHDENIVRYNVFFQRDGWRFDLTARFTVPSDIAMTDDFLDALEAQMWTDWDLGSASQR